MKEVNINLTIELDDKIYGVAVILAEGSDLSVDEICSESAKAPCQMAVTDQLAIFGALQDSVKARMN